MADPIRINAGPHPTVYTDSNGNDWATDSGFTGGFTYFNGDAVSGTVDDTLYQTGHYEEFGTLTWQASVANGNYLVNLKFCEQFQFDVGLRVFDVVINGVTVLNNYDIFATGGAFNAVDEGPFPVVASGGNGITIQFVFDTENPSVNAIEVLEHTILQPATGTLTLTGLAPSLKLTVPVPQASLTLTGFAPTIVTSNALQPPTGSLTITGFTPTVMPVHPSAGSMSLTGFAPTVITGGLVSGPIRVNAGPHPTDYTDSNGNVWAIDNGFTNGLTYFNSLPVNGTVDDTLYQTGHYESFASFSYQASVPNGTYIINLKFCEQFQFFPGDRVFHVDINGSRVLANFDIFATGGAFNAVDEGPFHVVVSAQQITIDFVFVTENPTVNAIEVLPAIILLPAAGSLNITGFAPTVISGAITLTPATGTLNLTGLAPSLKLAIAPPSASLTLTGFAPTILGGTLIQPATGSLTLTGLAPTLSLALNVPAGSLTVTGFAPTVSITGDVVLQPGTAILLLTGYFPVAVGTVEPGGGHPNVFRQHYINWDEITGNFDDFGDEFDLFGIDRGRPSIFRR